MHAAQHTHTEQAQHWCSTHIKVSQNTAIHQHIFTTKAASVDWRTYPDMQQTYQSVSKHILTSKNTLWCGVIHGIIERITMSCGVRVCSLIPWCRRYGQNRLIQWCILWCHDKLCDVNTWSVMPWCILWCQHDICDAMMYSVMSVCGLWCQDVFCDVIMMSVMLWYILWCGLWCHDAFSDVRTCEMILWCQVMFFDAVFHSVTVATGRGLAGKPRQTDPGMGWHQNWQFLPVWPVTHWCPPPWAEVSTAFTFFEITAIFPHTPSLASIPPFHLCPPCSSSHPSAGQKKKKNIKKTLWTWCFQFQAAGPLRKRQCDWKFKKIVQSRSDLVMVCVSVSYKMSVEENIKVNSEVKLLRSTGGTVPFLYTSVWW